MIQNHPRAPHLCVAVPQGDLDDLQSISLPAAIVVIDGSGKGTVSSLDGTALSVLELQARCLGGIATSEGGARTAAQFLASMADATGTATLPLCDLAKVKAPARETELLRFTAEGMATMLDRQARRAADLSRSLASLRQAHAQTQGSFAQLEKFVSSRNLAQRTEALSLLPGSDMPPIELREGEVLTQRLPLSSVGLSDVGLFVDAREGGGDGALSVTLVTTEDNVVHARWVLPESRVEPGPLRLALHAALGTSAMTPSLDLQWLGAGGVRLSTALYHPDPRMQARIGERTDTRVLALRCWSYLPDSQAAVPASAHLPADPGSRPPRIRVLDDPILAKVEDLTPASVYSRYIAEEEAVLVHPLGQGVSAMKVTGSVPAGAVHVDARIRTNADQAPLVEYALGIAPSNQKRLLPDIFEPHFLACMSSWVRLGPKQFSELHLPLPEPLKCDHDLFLMTRLAIQPGDTAWGWATFSRIRVALA